LYYFIKLPVAIILKYLISYTFTITI